MKASFQEIEVYYRDTLLQHGWEYISPYSEPDARSIKHKPGMKFRSDLDPTVLHVLAEQDTNDMIRVELRLGEFKLLLPR